MAFTEASTSFSVSRAQRGRKTVPLIQEQGRIEDFYSRGITTCARWPGSNHNLGRRRCGVLSLDGSGSRAGQAARLKPPQPAKAGTLYTV